MNVDVSSVTDIMRELSTKKFGRYKGVVVDDRDETGRGRLFVQVKDILGDEPVWMPGVFPLGGNDTQAFVFVPAIKSTVLVEFIAGDVSFPIWTGTYWDADVNPDPPEMIEVTDETHETLVRTKLGVEIRIVETHKEGEEAKVSFAIRTPDNAHMSIDEKGKVELMDKTGAGLIVEPAAEGAEASVTVSGHSGAEVKLTGNKAEIKGGNATITMDAGTVTIAAQTIKLDAASKVHLGQGASAPVLNAQSFLQAFQLHQHPAAPPTTGPVVAPIPAAAVSLQKVVGA